ncbi:cyclin-dependent kinase-activating kinase assembly factor-related / CDK-activating kinase assembly factor-related [Euphorbia peplus]|nr:cyclin-dependent kinase-activating kinase assembly factor-related / CDK-activating kinase assembly factor-related [Euphorbia peplus]
MVIVSGPSAQKEMSVRRRIASIFNKREDDFPSLRDYNDYLEEVEDMIFNLVAGVDIPAIEEKIAMYQKENAEQIILNQARKAEELAAALAASKGQPAAKADTDAIQNSQGGFAMEYAPSVLGGQPRPIGMAPQPFPVGGSGMDDEAMARLRGRAGGWSMEMCRKRALEEAFATIWV